SSYSTDTDGSALPIDESQLTLPFRVRTYSEEPQLQGKSFGDNLSWTAGGYYEERPQQPIQQERDVVFGTPLLTDRAGYLSTDSNNRALYAQGTYDLSALHEGIKFTAGYRYSWDRKFELERSLDGSGQCVSPPPGSGALCTLSGSTRFGGPNWTLGLDYQWLPQTLLYVTGRHGYHSGGLNLSATSENARTYRPETATDVEVGVKSDWAIAGVGVRTNLAIYHLAYNNVQTLETIFQADGQPTPAFGNAAGATNSGVEFEGTWSFTENLDIQTSFDWLDFKYTKFGPG